MDGERSVEDIPCRFESSPTGIIVTDDTPPSSQNSKKSDLDPITNRIDNFGRVSPVRTSSSLTESESQSGGSRKVEGESQGSLGESTLMFNLLRNR